MHRYSRVIRYHSDILAPSPAPESAWFGLCIYQTRDIRPCARQPLKRPYRVVKSRPTPKQRLPVQSNFFAVVLNPSTQAESAGFENSQFRAPMHRKSAEIVQNRTSPAAPTPIQPGAKVRALKYGPKREDSRTETLPGRKCSALKDRNAENRPIPTTPAPKHPQTAHPKRAPTGTP